MQLMGKTPAVLSHKNKTIARRGKGLRNHPLSEAISETLDAKHAPGCWHHYLMIDCSNNFNQLSNMFYKFENMFHNMVR